MISKLKDNSDDMDLSWEGKPSKRILFRKLTLNLRIIGTISVIALQFVNEFIEAFTSQDTIYDFLVDLANSSNIFVIAITVLILLFFFYLVVLLITNIGAIIWGALNYVTMNNYIDEDSIHIRKGVVFKQEFEIPLHKLTNVEINIHILDRVLRTADLHISTAGGADIYIMETLSQDDAYHIQGLLLTQISKIDQGFDNLTESFLSDPRIQQELKEIRELLIEVF